MIEWLTEIAAIGALVLLIASLYAHHISTSSLLVSRERGPLLSFIAEAGLVRTALEPGDLEEVIRVYESKYSRLLGLEIRPAFNLTIAFRDGLIEISARSWGGVPLPILNYTLTRVVLNESGVARVEHCSGSIASGYGVARMSCGDGVYVLLVSLCRLHAFQLFPEGVEVRENYDPARGVLHNSSRVERVYMIVPFYPEPRPAKVRRTEGGWALVEAEPGTVALIVVEEGSAPYVVERVRYYGGGGFAVELSKYVRVEYYALMIRAGERR